MEHKFQPGDEVRQKGGGPNMVVETYTKTGEVVCSYWQKGKRIQDAFVEATLEEVPPPSMPFVVNPRLPRY